MVRGSSTSTGSSLLCCIVEWQEKKTFGGLGKVLCRRALSSIVQQAFLEVSRYLVHNKHLDSVVFSILVGVILIDP